MRDVLGRLGEQVPSHVGLAYDVWAPVDHGEGKVADGRRSGWLERVQRIGIDLDYAEAYRRWKESFAADGRCQVVATTSRLLVGHGNPSGSDVGLTVHHTWGVPMIPGSALAGVLAHYVHEQLGGGEGERRAEPGRAAWRGPRYLDGLVVEPPGEHYGCLFGVPELAGDRMKGIEPSPGAAGMVTFCDALYVPGSAAGKPFVEDVLTVHHKEYYGREGAVPPTDHDDPNPVSFLGVGKGVELLLALSGPDAWTRVAMRLLLDALAWHGVGGKTSAGYGRLRVVEGASGSGGDGARLQMEVAPAPAEVGPVLAELSAWLDERAEAKTHARDVLAALEREWVARLVVLREEERRLAGRWIRKAIKHRKVEELAKELARRVEAGEQ